MSENVLLLLCSGVDVITSPTLNIHSMHSWKSIPLSLSHANYPTLVLVIYKCSIAYKEPSYLECLHSWCGIITVLCFCFCPHPPDCCTACKPNTSKGPLNAKNVSLVRTGKDYWISDHNHVQTYQATQPSSLLDIARQRIYSVQTVRVIYHVVCQASSSDIVVDFS